MTPTRWRTRSAVPIIAWTISHVTNPRNLTFWSTDGNPVLNFPRGIDSGANVTSTSSRFVVQKQGFLDVTTVFANETNTTIFDFNDATTCVSDGTQAQPLPFTLNLLGDGSFSINPSPTAQPQAIRCASSTARPSFKTFPTLSPTDISLFQHMISSHIVPYGSNHLPDAPRKPFSVIRQLGKQFFPWTENSFELAMAVYDWTTASFARVVFMKVFEYTSLQTAEGGHPLDVASIADMIYASNWSTYTPTNATYMRSFLLHPASSLDNVTTQLTQNNNSLLTHIHDFSLAQNRLLSAALASLPRTTILAKPLLFSGQVDIAQFGTSRFGIEFREWPGNAGPVGSEMGVELASALSSFVSPGNTVTTKMVWSFTDSVEDAAHYSNGILLVVGPPEEADDPSSFVWDTTTYITPLSDDPAKTEYIFPPGSRFRVKSVESMVVGINTLQLIRLEVLGLALDDGKEADSPAQLRRRTHPKSSTSLKHRELDHLRKRILASSKSLPQLEHTLVTFGDGSWSRDHVREEKTNGRWCQCVEMHRAVEAELHG